MHSDHKIFFPAFLILFASFLAFSYSDVGYTVDYSISKLGAKLDVFDGGNKITGYDVGTGPCGDGTILELYGENNSHLSVVGAGSSITHCAELSGYITVSDPTRNCYADLSNLVGYVSDGSDVSSKFNKPMGLYAGYNPLTGFTEAIVVDSGNNCIRWIEGDGTVNSFSETCGSSGSLLNNPTDIVWGGGDYYYVADRDNHCIRKLGSQTGVLQTFVGQCGGGTGGYGNGVGTDASFDEPSGLAVDVTNRILYVADKNNHVIRMVNIDTEEVSLLAGVVSVNGGDENGDFTSAQFESPSGLTLDVANNILYVADTGNGKVRKLEVDNQEVTTLSTAVLYGPKDVEYYGGNVYVSDTNGHSIMKIDSSGSATLYAGKQSESGFVDGSKTEARFNFPGGLSVDPVGNLFVADTENNAIRVIPLSTDIPFEVYTLGGDGSIGSDDGSIAVSNAHFYDRSLDVGGLPGFGKYVRVCYDQINCEAKNSCEPNEECLMSIGDGTGGLGNAHAGSCGTYANDICCEPGWTPGSYCGDGTCDSNENCLTCTNDCPCPTGEVCNPTTAMCDPPPGGDTDGDGIDDFEDNCPLHPNNGNFGTCITDDLQTQMPSFSNPDPNTVPHSCSSNADCIGKTVNNVPVSYCEKTQANDDYSGGSSNDECGNACDLDSTDPCTCTLTGELCPPVGDCGQALQGADFDWNPIGSVERGASVDVILDLEGDDRCDGEQFIVSILDDEDNPCLSCANMLLSVTNDYGSVSWIAQNNNPSPPDPPLSAYWKAKAVDGSLVITTSSLLEVTASGGTVCGDANIDPGEQCDDGNNDDGDGCSSDCLIEGLDGPGSGDGCSSYCVSGTTSCDPSDPSVIYYCLAGGDGCNDMDGPHSCSSGTICNNEFGSCVSPACSVKNDPTQANPACTGVTQTYVCGIWTDCVNGQRTRICNLCNTGTNCVSEPIEQIACSIEPAVKGPVFDLLAWMIAMMILTLFYLFRNKKIKVTLSC